MLLPVIAVFGQDLPKPVKHLVKQLKKRGADTILVYISGCDGCFIRRKNINCTCFKKESITEVSLIFSIKGKFNKEDFSCCQDSALTEINAPESIRYFLSLQDTLKKKDEYYKQAAKRLEFFPPIATDNPYEQVELIIPGHNYDVSLSYWQINDGYQAWKKYFWIESEIKLMDLIRKDISVH